MRTAIRLSPPHYRIPGSGVVDYTSIRGSGSFEHACRSGCRRVMEYLFTSILICSFALGVTTFIRVLVVSKQRATGIPRDRNTARARWIVIALASYLLLMAGITFLYYAEPFYDKKGASYVALLITMRIATAVLIAPGVLFIQELTEFPRTRIGPLIARLAIGPAVVVFVMLFLRSLLDSGLRSHDLRFLEPSDAFIYAAIQYMSASCAA